MRVCLPFPAEMLADVPDGFEYVVADATVHWPEEASHAELYVPAYRFDRRPIDVVATMPNLRIIQTLTAGVEHFLPIPGGVTLCNAAGVHDAATSELAVGLMIAAERDFASVFEGTRQQSGSKT